MQSSAELSQPAFEHQLGVNYLLKTKVTAAYIILYKFELQRLDNALAEFTKGIQVL